ncbi:NUDIX hydrolase [Roseomonas sp. GC11]|uniref:NUDIX domain-containing protein n=1 Tax=Roseomonas sp. GC11 TaxID=2950546 RepID=UPI00210880AF|nr:NUDIX hydrolase [Roseomonas sp. GC11]MCQ4159815.1 NUDIX hydrolase [Roseomonas sp. GC11]
MADEITTLSSRIAYANRWLRVREDIIRRPDGAEGLYGVVERSDFVVLLPWQDGRLTLVEQYRYPIRARQWELPMGTWEQAPETDPLHLAAAELREETGLVAARLERLGTIFQGAGYCNQKGHVFLATGLEQHAHAREATEQDMVCRSFTLAEVEAMARNGTLQDAPTLAALALARIQGVW